MSEEFDATNLLIENIPVGIVHLNSEMVVSYANQAAVTFGFLINESIRDTIHIDSAKEFECILSRTSLLANIQLSTEIGSTPVRISAHPHANVLILCIEDQSELIAVSRQLQNSKQPERKFIHDLSNAFTSTMGYSELIAMMLEEESYIDEERLQSLLRYQTEVMTGLKKVDLLIKEYKLGKRALDDVMVPIRAKHIMIVDDEPSIAEFLSELMRANKYKVSSFTSSLEALAFFNHNSANVDLVILDQVMPEMSGINLATELLGFNIELPIILCTGDHQLIEEQSSGKVSIEHFISKPIDISELNQMVSAIID